MNEKQLSGIYRRITGYTKEIIDIQKKLTAIPALGPDNGGQGESAKAIYIKKLLKNLNYDSLEELNAPDDRVTAGYRPNLFMKKKAVPVK